MKHIKQSLLVVATALSLSFSHNVMANEAAISSAKNYQASDASIIAKLNKLGLKATKVEDSPIANIKQVTTSKGLFYVTADNSYFIQGRVFDLNNNFENLTDKASATIRIDGLAELEQSMIVFPAKDEKYQVSVFTDPSCGYCRKLHSEMAEYNDLGITIKYLAFPRGGLNSETYHDIKSVWCAKDQHQAMTSAKATGGSVVAAKCSAPIKAHFELGRSFGVTGTPAMILADGTMVPGYKSPKDLLKALRAN